MKNNFIYDGIINMIGSMLAKHFEYDTSLFRLNDDSNLAQDLSSSGAATSTFSDMPVSGYIFVNRLFCMLEMNGKTDADGWGIKGSKLASGWQIVYKTNSSATERKLTVPIDSYGKLACSFNEKAELLDFGSGNEVFVASHTFPNKIKINLTDGGYVQIKFAGEDYADNGKIELWNAGIQYYTQV